MVEKKRGGGEKEEAKKKRFWDEIPKIPFLSLEKRLEWVKG